MKKITKDWLESGKSDLQMIKKVIDDKELTHLASFHAQQAIEKAFKALIEEFDLGFVKVHSLETLYFKVMEKLTIEVDNDQIRILDQLYIDARYPGEMGLLPNGKPTIKDVQAFFTLANNIHQTVASICK